MFPRACCRSASLPALTAATLAATTLAALAWAAPALAAPDSADCAAPGAVYRLATDPEGRQGEMRLAEDPELMAGMAMVLALPGHPETRFEMIQGQGYGSTSVWVQPGGVLPESDDGFPLLLFEEGPDGRLLPYADGIPFADSPAPAAFVIPGLGAALWYDSADRIGLDTAIWYLHACGG